MARPAIAPPESTVETACPLDCPDACTLSVTLRGGRIARIDGGTANEVTRGYICAKVRHFDQRVYGDDRLLYPAIRKGAKGAGLFRRVTWDDALDAIAENLQKTVAAHGGEAVLPLCYGGSNGMLTQDFADAMLFRRLKASRLLRTVCAAPTGAANLGLYGKMPSVVYQDYPEARLIIIWGVNPGASGIHLMPYLKEAREARRHDRRHRSRARRASHGRRTCTSPVRPGTDLVVALALHRHLFETGRADQAFLERAHDREPRPCASGRRPGPSSGRRRCRACPPSSCNSSRNGTRRRARLWSNAGGGWSGTATAAAPRPRCWRCRRWAASSACAAAATR